MVSGFTAAAAGLCMTHCRLYDTQYRAITMFWGTQDTELCHNYQDSDSVPVTMTACCAQCETAELSCYSNNASKENRFLFSHESATFHTH